MEQEKLWGIIAMIVILNKCSQIEVILFLFGNASKSSLELKQSPAIILITEDQNTPQKQNPALFLFKASTYIFLYHHFANTKSTERISKWRRKHKISPVRGALANKHIKTGV